MAENGFHEENVRRNSRGRFTTSVRESAGGTATLPAAPAAPPAPKARSPFRSEQEYAEIAAIAESAQRGSLVDQVITGVDTAIEHAEQMVDQGVAAAVEFTGIDQPATKPTFQPRVSRGGGRHSYGQRKDAHAKQVSRRAQEKAMAHYERHLDKLAKTQTRQQEMAHAKAVTRRRQTRSR